MPRGLTTEEKAEHLAALREIAEGQGGECLSKSYVNSQSKLKWRCAEGHEWDAIARNVREYSWCPLCAMAKRSGKRGK
jgi:hypothetical protein